jgi:hypothetical protein
MAGPELFVLTVFDCMLNVTILGKIQIIISAEYIVLSGGSEKITNLVNPGLWRMSKISITQFIFNQFYKSVLFWYFSGA